MRSIFSPRAISAMEVFQRQTRLQDLMARDKGKCQHCSRPVRILKLRQGQRQPRDMATEDHIITKTAGGTNALENLLLSCFPCNNDRGNQPLEAFRARRKTGR